MLDLLGPRAFFGGGVSPLLLDPALWLKSEVGLYQERTGASATTAASADTDPVGTWLDQSGNGRHLTAPADNQRPILKLAIQNGRPVVRLDGSDDKMVFAASLTLNDYSFFIVQKSSNDGMFFGGPNDQVRIGDSGNNRLSLYRGGAFVVSNTLTNPRTEYSLVEYHRTGTSVSFFEDGVAKGTASLSGTHSLDDLGSTGPYNYLAGDLCEILVFPHEQGPNARAEVRSYLNGRWGIY